MICESHFSFGLLAYFGVIVGLVLTGLILCALNKVVELIQEREK